MEVIKAGIFAQARDLADLNIIDWSRLNGYWESTYDAIEQLGQYMIGRASYTVVSDPLHEYPERDDWPGWKHVGDHENLGRLYWNCFHATMHGEIIFADQPDMSGILFAHDDGCTVCSDRTPQRFFGDIGKVSPSTFLFTFNTLRPGQLWISVPDEETQIILESLTFVEPTSIARLRRRALSRGGDFHDRA